MVELIIAEKPAASEKIAKALADDKVEKKQEEGVAYYKIKHNGKKIYVACAVGHLYNLTEEKKSGWTYPVFNIEWKASYLINKDSAFTKKYVDALKILSKKSDEFTVATDFDLEGSTIGYNVIRFISGKKDAKRMKYSTLTKDELVESYEKATKHLDWPQIEAGETRHFMDFYYGINLSRALTLAIKSVGRFKVMSSGRVQGPALKLIVDKEKEIMNFKPKKYWQLELIGNIKKTDISAWHNKDKFWEKKEAEKSLKNSEGKKAVINDLKKRTIKQEPPVPFDLTNLQMEAYRVFGISPKQTLALAQDLYLAGLISYPRTSSQQLPEALNYKKIITLLSKNKSYKEICEELLKRALKPNNGKKVDLAHPALHPTGEIPDKVGEKELKIYDLIVRRTLASFGKEALRENMEMEIDVNKEIFVTKGSRTIESGWHTIYKYLKFEDQLLPDVKKGEEVKVKEIKMYEKETMPPKRFTPASIIKELSKRNLGTKATRSEIVDTLFNRNYVYGESIQATDLGIKVIETLEKYSPDILDEKLTRYFEKEMDQIQKGKLKKEKVLEEARKILTKILTDFKKKEKNIGEALVESIDETQNEMNLIGKCPKCEGDLKIMFSPKTKSKFIGCSNYPKCTAIFNVPKTGLIKNTKNLCKVCNYPKMLVIRKGKRPQEICINPDCKSKQIDESLLKEKRNCPKCGKELVIRKGPYGPFFACPGYPNCKHIEAINVKGSNKKK